MSDLSCPVRLVVARHAHAAYVETWFSDEGGWLTTEGRAQATRLGEALRDRRVAAVWSSDSARAVQTAELAARALRLDAVQTRTGLREMHIGDLLGQPFSLPALTAVTDRWYDGELDAGFPGGETGHAVVARYADVLGEIADSHRGERVLVVGHQMAASVSLPVLAGLPPTYARGRLLGHAEYAELDLDAGGGRLSSWAGRALEPGRP